VSKINTNINKKMITLKPFYSTSSLVDEIFDSMSKPSWSQKINSVHQSVNNWGTVEKENGLEFEMFVPGLTKKDVSVKIEDRNLKIIASYKSDVNSYEVTKSFTLGDNIDVDVVKATVENGVLKISLPFYSPKSKTKNVIEVL